ncbi:XRE family transcriptional regulator [Epibacterium sp. DP7N7-1]|nr:XRE family transcriptional regulator [Epibacterium sp. DP7N7-1]
MNGSRLEVARKRKGYSRPQLAELLGVTSRTINGWESNGRVPEDRVEALVRELGFSREFLSLPDPASVSTNAVSFRSLSRKTATQRDAALAMCDLAVDLSAWIDQRFGRNDVSLPNLSDEEPEFSADLLRLEWALGKAPISNMIHLLEAKGVRVFALPNNCREIDACSFWMSDIPYMLVDTTRSAERIRFNLAHELGHLVLHRHGAPMGQTAEKEANAFASAFLMTEASLQQRLPRQMSVGSVVRMKQHWGVSAMALAYRLNKVGRLRDWHYKTMVIEMRRRKYHEAEPEPMAHEQSYVLDLVLRTLLQRNISLRAVAEETRLPHNEVVGLMQGLATFAISEHDVATPSERRAALRVV